MAQYTRMQDQVKNRIEAIMADDQKYTDLDDFVQTVVTLAIVFVFLVFGLTW